MAGARGGIEMKAVALAFLVLSLAASAVIGGFALRGRFAEASTFNPSFEAALANTAAGANANISTVFGIPAPDSNFGYVVTFTPSEFTVASDAAVPNGAHVADLSSDVTLGLINGACNSALPLSFDMMDATTNTANTVTYMDGFQDFSPLNGLPDAVDRYPVFLNTLFPGATPRARFYGQVSVAGTPVAVNFVLFELGTSLAGLPSFPADYGYPSVTVLGDPVAAPSPNPITDFCTPLETSYTVFGVSQNNPDTPPNEGGYVVRRNPSLIGAYLFRAWASSLYDADSDGIENGLDTCPFVANLGDPRVPGSGDMDNDGLDDACDPEPDVTVVDVDGDAFTNRQDNCPLAADDNTDSDRDQIGDACDPNPGVPDGHYHEAWRSDGVAITASGTPTATPRPTATPPKPWPTPRRTPTATPPPWPTPTATSTPPITPTPWPTPTPTAPPLPTASPTPTSSPPPTPTAWPTATPTPTPTSTRPPKPWPTPRQTVTATPPPTPTPWPTFTPTRTSTPRPTTPPKR
jgi:hypothetical protein